MSRNDGTVSGNFFIIAAQGNVLLEADRNGKILGKVFLDKKKHRQPEGITFLDKNTLVIGDEGDDGRARLTIYRAGMSD